MSLKAVSPKKSAESSKEDDAWLRPPKTIEFTLPPEFERRLARRVNWSSALAGVVGACALGVSIYTVLLQRAQTRAQVWPRLSTTFQTDTELFALELENPGVGPAILKSSRLFLQGVPVKGPKDILERLKVPKPWSYSEFSAEGEWVLAAGREAKVFVIRGADARKVLMPLMDDITLSACYCSVLGECWLDTTGALQEVDRCPSSDELKP
jgi:hypothetical protein